jgi:hypothetical protein
MPPKVGTKGAKKAVTKAKTARAGGDKKRRRRRRESYALYRLLFLGSWVQFNNMPKLAGWAISVCD